MNLNKKNRSGSARTTPVNKKDNQPLGAKILKERAPVKGKDIAALVLDLMWSGDKEGNEMVGIPAGDSR
jgi:hypothetical protein